MTTKHWKQRKHKASPYKKWDARTNGPRRNKEKQLRQQQNQVLRDRLQSPNTKLWFGIYEGSKIKDIPLDYLKWMVSEMHRNSKRIHLLCEFLESFIKDRPATT